MIGRRVRVLLNANDLIVYDGRVEVTRHVKLLAKCGSSLVLDHYIETTVRKPGALPELTALEQARSAGTFTPAHDVWWAVARKAHGDGAPAPTL